MARSLSRKKLCNAIGWISQAEPHRAIAHEMLFHDNPPDAAPLCFSGSLAEREILKKTFSADVGLQLPSADKRKHHLLCLNRTRFQKKQEEKGPQDENSERESTMTSTATMTTTKATTDTSLATVKQLAREMVDNLCNTRDYTSPFIQKHISPAFSATHNGVPSADRADFLATIGKAMQAMPDFHVEVLDIVAEVDEASGKAKVWVFSKMSGFPGGKLAESVDMMEWDGDVCVRGKDVQRIFEA